jgi:hypothetical protein
MMATPEFHTATVAELLSLSRSAHDRYRACLPRVNVPGDGRLAHDALQDAYRLRQQAEQADPARSDPAWQLDRIPHGELMAFFAAKLGTGR